MLEGVHELNSSSCGQDVKICKRRRLVLKPVDHLRSALCKDANSRAFARFLHTKSRLQVDCLFLGP
jgi:hypothetical protein